MVMKILKMNENNYFTLIYVTIASCPLMQRAKKNNFNQWLSATLVSNFGNIICGDEKLPYGPTVRLSAKLFMGKVRTFFGYVCHMTQLLK